MSSKRSRSTSPSSPSTSSRKGKGKALQPQSTHTISDLFPYQEIFIRILSFLSPNELAAVQNVNKYWARMSLDPQLWKGLYLSRYPHPHHSRLIYKDKSTSRHTAPSTPTRALRPIARLPSRAFPPPSPSRSPSASSIAAVSSSPVDARLSSSEGNSGKLQGSTPNEEEVGYGVRHDGLDWKMMLKLGTNWSNGNALSQSTIVLPPSPSPSISSVDSVAQLDIGKAKHTEQHIALTPSFIFTSNPTSPLLSVHRSTSTSAASSAPLGLVPPPPGWSSPARPDNITAICADQAVDSPNPGIESSDSPSFEPVLPARVAVFYQSGGFVILRVRLVLSEKSLSPARLSWTREAINPPQSRSTSLRRRPRNIGPVQGDPVVLSAMHYPILLTCTLAFHLSVYTLSPPKVSGGEPSRPLHLSTMHSDVSFHPASLSLFPVPSKQAELAYPPTPDPERKFRCALTYSTPLYPSSWTIAVQEFGVNLARRGNAGDVWRGECLNVGRSDVVDGGDEIIWPKRLRPIIGVRGRQAVGVGMDGRWCILAGEDNQIQVYSLPTTSVPTSRSRDQSIHHSHTLLAHSAAVTTVSLNAGRCVSGGRDGRILVWELDEEDEEDSGKLGRTVGYVEVRPGGRRKIWRGPTGPAEDDEEEEEGGRRWQAGLGLPHPASISAAARSLFLPRPPVDSVRTDERPPVIRNLVFDEERIVGLVRDIASRGRTGEWEVMRVWSFST